jgi:hypothetical protein
MDEHAAEPTLSDVADDYPDWEVTTGVNGLCYGRLYRVHPPVLLVGEDPLDLRDQIRGWLGRNEWR